MDYELNDNFKVGSSQIHGKGTISTKEIEPGEQINIALYKGDSNIYHTTKFGSHLNHSYSPNAVTKDEGDRYITYCEKKIKPGDEITVDYTHNSELEQPDPSWQ